MQILFGRQSPGAWFSAHIERVFYRIGFFVGLYPIHFLIIPLIITAAGALGVLRFFEENRIWYLYSPTDAPSHYEHAIATEFFDEKGGKFWVEVPVTARDTGNLLRPDYLEAVNSLADYLLFNFTVPCSDDDMEPKEEQMRCSFDDMCEGQCNDNQVVPIFMLLYRNVSQRNHPNFRLTYPTMHLYNDEYYVGEQFSGVEIDPKTNRINSIRLIVLYFRTDMRNEQVQKALGRWELQLLDYVKKFDHPLINFTASSDGIISHEVRRNGMSCVPFFPLSVMCVLVFAIVTNITKNEVFVSVREATLGVLGPLLAITTTFGLMNIIGLAFNSIVLIMPFLVIGIGVDDFFICVHAWRNTDKRDSLAHRTAIMMKEAGPSITITSLTNALSFITGVFTPIPAIQIFCLYSTAGCIIDFLYQISFVAAAIACQEHFTEFVAKVAKKLPFCKKFVVAQESNEKSAGQQNAPTQCIAVQTAPPVSTKQPLKMEMSAHFEEKVNSFIAGYCKFLVRWPVRISIYSVVVVYWMLAAYGCSFMQLKMDSSNLILNDSPLQPMEWIYDTFTWREGSLVYIFVNDPPDLSKVENQNRMLTMVDRFETLKFSMGKNSTSIWLRPFLNNAILYESENSTSFNRLLAEWLNNDIDGGGRWRNFVHFRVDNVTNEAQIEKFFFASGTAMGDEVSWATRTLLQESWRGVADDFPDFNVTVFQAYSFYVDQLGTIEGMTINNVVTTLIIMALVCLLLIPNPTSVISATAAMISINIGVFGFLFAWDTDLDPITMITITMSIGYSVDFTAHISYHFYRNDATWSNEKRLAHALASIGFPMMQAGTSCFLGVVPLMLVNSYMVYVFIKTIFLVIVLGLIHGLLFLPALLLSIGKIDTWCKKKCIKSAEEHSCAPVENVITLPDISMQIVPMGPPFNTTDSASTERDDESTRTVQQMAFVATPSFQEARDNKSGLSAQRSL